MQVPPGAQAGQMMQITSPAGVAMQVQIPAGMYPGSTFAVASPAAPALGVVEGVSYAAEEAGDVLQAKVVPSAPERRGSGVCADGLLPCLERAVPAPSLSSYDNG